jgi:hypothetical protein
VHECAAIWRELNFVQDSSFILWRFRSSFILRAGLGPALARRVYIADEPDRSYRAVETKLVCITPYQLSATHIVCQGFERIEHCLVSVICQQLGG